MLPRGYTLRMTLPECNPSAQKVNALVELPEDISEALPYVNTVLKGRQYNENEKILIVKRGGHLITFWPRQIALTKLEDETKAKAVVEELIRILNEAYANRDHIEPTNTSRPVPRPPDIFKLLPGKNCKEIGESTCMAFALKITNDEAEWGKCPLLFEKEYETSRLKLMEVLLPGENSFIKSSFI